MYQRGGKSKVTGAKVADMDAAGRFTSYSINRTNLRIRSESSDCDGLFAKLHSLFHVFNSLRRIYFIKNRLVGQITVIMTIEKCIC